MTIKLFAVCGLLLAAAGIARAQDSYADSVVSYLPGTGDPNEPNYYLSSNDGAALGAPDTGATVSSPAWTPGQIIGVGVGGELTVEFDTPITNDPAGHAFGLDFTIFGNDFFSTSGSNITGLYNHTGLTVWVSQDDTTFYQLVAPDGLAHGADDYYPTEGSGNALLPVNPTRTLSDFINQTSAYDLSLYNGSAGGSSYSISWAQNSSGAAVDLPSISYIKIEGSTGYGYIDAISRVQSTTEAIPEPGNVALIILGAASLLWIRRFRRGAGGFEKAVSVILAAGAFLIAGRTTGEAQGFTLSNIQYWVGSGTNESAMVVSWNDGISPDSLVFGYKWNAPATGSFTMYTMMAAIEAADSDFQFTANPAFANPTGDYAVYSMFYNLTGGAGPVVGIPGNLGGTESGYAPASDHYKEGWFTGFWGELLANGDPYTTGSWNSNSAEGVAYDTLNNGAWYGLSFSTDVTNFTIPNPGTPNAAFPVPVPEPANRSLLASGLLGLIGFRKWRRLKT